MQRVIGIDPIITIISVIGAYILFGIVGAIFIIPLIAVMQIMLGGELDEMSRRNDLEV
jgi:predicted PurR-regulated permease PerM